MRKDSPRYLFACMHALCKPAFKLNFVAFARSRCAAPQQTTNVIKTRYQTIPKVKDLGVLGVWFGRHTYGGRDSRGRGLGKFKVSAHSLCALNAGNGCVCACAWLHEEVTEFGKEPSA